MRKPKILDVLHAIREIAPSHAEVRAWWYAPPPRLQLDPRARGARPSGIEVVVEADFVTPALCNAIAGELAHRLGRVSVRRYDAEREERSLYRLLGRRV